MSVLVGRERELDELSALIGPPGTRITLVGPGGVGKTRLARELRPWAVCELGSARTRQDLAAAWAAAFGAAADGAALGPALVLLDGVEQLPADALADLDRSLAGAEVRVVLTSRRPLGIGDEQLFPVRPLAVDAAVALFVEAARRRDPAWRPSEADLDAIRELAGHLDRLPLALELAAARRAVVSPREMLSRLDDRFRLLRPLPGAPVRALLDVIADSWTALDETAREVLAGATVFRGGFTLTAAQHVLDCTAFLPDVLQALTDGNLVVTTTDAVTGETRFEPYESVREFALPFAADAALADRHARWVEDLLADAERRFREGPVGVLRHALAAERWNVVAAFEHLLDHDPVRALGVAVSGSRIAALDAPDPWLDRIALATARVPDPSPELAARTAGARAGLLFDAGRARASADVAAQASTAAGDWPAHRARLLRVLGQALWRLGDTAGSGVALRDAHAAAVEAGAGCEEAAALLALETVHRAEDAHRYLLAALERARILCDPWMEGAVLVSMSARDLDLGLRRTRNEDALALGPPAGLMVRAVAHGNLAKLDLEAGRPDEAVRQAEAGLALAVAWPYTRRWLLGLLAGGLVDAGRHAEADAALVAASRLRVEAGDRSAAGSQLERAEWHVARGALAAAIPSFAAVESAGAYPAITLRRAQVLAAIGDPGAEEALARATAAEPASPPWDALVAGTRALVRREPIATACAELRRHLAAAPLRGQPDLRRWIRLLLATVERVRPAGHVLDVQSGGSAYVLDGTRVDLSRRGAQRRILLHLALAREREDGAASDVYDLFEAGWPGERASHAVVTSRVYNAVQRLRDSGLRGVLVQTGDGYLLDPDTVLHRS